MNWNDWFHLPSVFEKRCICLLLKYFLLKRPGAESRIAEDAERRKEIFGKNSERIRRNWVPKYILPGFQGQKEV